MTTVDGRRLEPHELRDALLPGLFPGPDNAPDTVAEWDGLDELREQHEHALDRYRRELDRLSREQDDNPNATKRHKEEARLRSEVAMEINRIVWEARDLLDEWRAVEDDTEAERNAEIERLRARLAVLEQEDLMRKRLAVWLKRFHPIDDAHITTGIHPWARMAEPPEPVARPSGPFARAFQHEEENG